MGAEISDVLNEDESELIVNLSSNEYFKAVDKKTLNANVLDIVFKEKKGEVYKVIGIYAKRARGLHGELHYTKSIEESRGTKRFCR